MKTKTVSLNNRIDVSQHGGMVFPADLTGDGKSDFLILQSPGLFHADVHKEMLPSPDHPGRTHFCLTAMSGAGEILWRHGEPWRREEPWPTHGGERSLCVVDLDGDGRDEVCVIKGNAVLILNARTGETINEFPLPYDNFVNLLPGRTAPGKDGIRLLASPSNPSYDGREHGGPTLIFDPSGNVVFNRDVFGFGHDPVALDVDGDGLDEWLVGYELLDHDFSPLWRFQPCPMAEYDGLEMHVDGLSLHMLGEPSERRIAYAASEFLYVIDGDGELVWEKKLVHPQQVHYARMSPNADLPQLFVLNKRDDLQLFDFNGEELWSVTPEENWPNCKPSGLNQKFHLFEPTVKLDGAAADGGDLIVYFEGGWPYGIDGTGNRVVEFECPPSTRQPDLTSNHRRPDDYGWGYAGKRLIDADGTWLLVHDRSEMYLYQI